MNDKLFDDRDFVLRLVKVRNSAFRYAIKKALKLLGLKKVIPNVYDDDEKLRKDLIDYFGSAMFSGLPMAIIDLSDVDVASNDKLLELAKKISLI